MIKPKTNLRKETIFITLLIFTLILSIASVSASESDSISLDDGNCLDDSIDSDIGNIAIEENVKDNAILKEERLADSSIGETADANSSKKETVKITAKDLTKYYKGSANYTAKLVDGNGKALKNRSVSLTITNKTYNRITDKYGSVSLAINLKVGTYKIVAKDLKSGTKLTSTVKVLTTIKSSDISKLAGDKRKFQATFLKGDGKALANKYVKFKISGKTHKVKTNSNGVASLSLIDLKKGTYKIISYNTDGLSKVNYIKVVNTAKSKLLAKNYTFLTSDKKAIQVTLHNQFDYAPGPGKVVKFTVNGKTYSNTTDSKGIARLTLPKLSKGTYTVKYKFDGNQYYKASSAAGKVIILPNKSSKLTVKGTKTFGYGADTQLKVQLTASDIPIPNRKIIITVRDKNYTKVTDNSGISYLTIKLKPNTYKISYRFKGESKINAASGSEMITVRERTKTKIVWKSSDAFFQGYQNYKVLLTDFKNGTLANKTIRLTVNDNSYSAVTNDKGIAKFSVNMITGNFTVKYSFDGNNYYGPSSNKQNISIDKKELNGFGYWIFSTDMKKVNLDTLSKKGTTDLFLYYKAVSSYGKSTVEDWISKANNLNMRVHIWMPTFYSDSWINPVKNGSANTAAFNKIIKDAKYYASLKGVAGIHFDYIRYPGNAYKTKGSTDAINTFVKKACTALHDSHPKILLSASLMPETTHSAYYYGQDYSVISKYMDIVIPMIYKGNYGQSTEWITTTAKWYAKNSKGAAVWGGIQSYNSDNDVTKLTSSSLKTDAKAVLNGNGDGVVLFRWGITNFLDFNSIK